MPDTRHSFGESRKLDRRGFLITAAKGLGAAASVPLVPGLLRAAERHTPAAFRFIAADQGFSYSRPCFSPSGDRVLFMVAPVGGGSASPSSNLRSWSLWTMPVSGGAPKLLLEQPDLRTTRPDWSRASGRIAFTGIRGEEAGLWLVNEDGSELTHIPVGDPPLREVYYPSWYPDGRSIAVTDYATRRALRFYLESREVEPLTDPDEIWVGMCSVSPDTDAGNPIAFAGQRPGERYDSGQNRIWVKFPGQSPYELDQVQGRNPSWSPDGKRIAFVSVRDRPAPSHTLHPRQLRVRSPAVFVRKLGSTTSPSPPAVAITPFGFRAVHGKWSPDGERIVCMAYRMEDERDGIAFVDLASEYL